MDTEHFDRITRSLTHLGSRRRSLAVLLGSTFGVLGLVDPDDAEAGRGCTRPCGECGFCKKGKCTRKRGKKTCERGKCLEIPDGTPCSIGTCLVGQCAPAR
jgi:hypothetical protein